ncbi:DUF6265 family protein [Winogradskyella rapida]|uniref:DUF6265 family protein n=1 Tax=Winogradskyella rapida TaxID=549701 RepID=A0ABW3KM58_9FLAO
MFYEIEVIREVENSLMLQLKHFSSDLTGWKSIEETVNFPLKEITENKVTFEGMTFEKVSANEITIDVAIKNKNQTVDPVKFNYNN